MVAELARSVPASLEVYIRKIPRESELMRIRREQRFSKYGPGVPGPFRKFTKSKTVPPISEVIILPFITPFYHSLLYSCEYSEYEKFIFIVSDSTLLTYL